MNLTKLDQNNILKVLILQLIYNNMCKNKKKEKYKIIIKYRFYRFRIKNLNKKTRNEFDCQKN